MFKESEIKNRGPDFLDIFFFTENFVLFILSRKSFLIQKELPRKITEGKPVKIKIFDNLRTELSGADHRTDFLLYHLGLVVEREEIGNGLQPDIPQNILYAMNVLNNVNLMLRVNKKTKLPSFPHNKHDV